MKTEATTTSRRSDVLVTKFLAWSSQQGIYTPCQLNSSPIVVPTPPSTSQSIISNKGPPGFCADIPVPIILNDIVGDESSTTTTTSFYRYMSLPDDMSTTDTTYKFDDLLFPINVNVDYPDHTTIAKIPL